MWTWSRSVGSSGRVFAVVLSLVEQNGRVTRSRKGSNLPSKSTIETVLQCGGVIKVATSR